MVLCQSHLFDQVNTEIRKLENKKEFKKIHIYVIENSQDTG